LAIVDPVLTITAPPLLTATTGLDTLTHLLEGYVSTRAWSLTDGLAIYGMELVARHLARAVKKGDDLIAREGMAMASLIGGLVLSNSALGAVHGLAHPLTARYGISHGMVNGILLSYVMEYNSGVCSKKFGRIAQIFGEEPLPQKAVESVRNLTEEIGIPLHLREAVAKEIDLPLVAREALPTGSTRYNPRPLEEADLIAILKNAY
jgi:alcohol dehydrogenase class IV